MQLAILEWGGVGCSRWCDIAGGERVPLSPGTLHYINQPVFPTDYTQTQSVGATTKSFFVLHLDLKGKIELVYQRLMLNENNAISYCYVHMPS